MSLPHTPPVGGGNQERQNRKLLEQLQEQKKRLQYGHHGSSSSASSAITVPAVISNATPSVPGPSAAEYANISNPQQRAALQHAHANSVGYFITQDSSFGNLILPVLPRIQEVKPEAAK